MISRLLAPRVAPGRWISGSFVAVTLGVGFAFSGIAAAGATAIHHVHNTATVRSLVPRPSHGAIPALGSGNLINHGGPVQNAPKVYVVFWHWTSDPRGEQPYLSRFLSSLGGGTGGVTGHQLTRRAPTEPRAATPLATRSDHHEPPHSATDSF